MITVERESNVDKAMLLKIYDKIWFLLKILIHKSDWSHVNLDYVLIRHMYCIFREKSTCSAVTTEDEAGDWKAVLITCREKKQKKNWEAEQL